MSEIIDRLTAALAGRYRIERELGQGGMATVYLAADLKHDRKVALRPPRGAQLVRRTEEAGEAEVTEVQGQTRNALT